MVRRGNRRIRRLVLPCVAGILAIGTSTTHASLISFDPDGTQTANGPLSVSSFEYLPGNLLLKNGIQSVSIGSSYTTDVYFHAKLGQLLDANSHPLAINNFLGSSTSPTAFELTAVAQFSASVKRISSTSYAVSLTTGSVAAFNIYYDTDSTKRANDLTGEGFGDGTAILTGTVSDVAASSFRLSGAGGAMDQFGGVDNYSGITATTVAGHLNLSVDVQSQDTNFFQNGAALTSMTFESNLRSPFNAVDPSQNFRSVDSHNTLVQPTFVSNNDGTAGGDLQLQSSSNSALFTMGSPVPEPGSVAVFLTLAGLYYVRNRRHQKSPHIRQVDKR